ncbi:negative modulator of initiation of replication [Acrasis kona]|uniref:Negative modulator of initiation of replication n=1 Tax=Acrasis kona TaxID=1008807 RepID=A0AAW2ZQU8_9EUKA
MGQSSSTLENNQVNVEQGQPIVVKQPTTNAPTEPMTLPRYFPKYTKECEVVANNFFECFTEKGRKTQKGDKLAGATGLEQCKDLLQKYKDCMEK